jgi:hypothetical protein
VVTLREMDEGKGGGETQRERQRGKVKDIGREKGRGKVKSEKEEGKMKSEQDE